MAKRNKQPKVKPQLEFIVLIGAPCCGKTTHTKHPKYKDHVVVSMDDIIMEQNPDMSYQDAYKRCNWKEAEKVFKSRYIDEAAKKERSIIIDRTNMGSKSRRKLIANLPPEYRKIALIFNWDVKELKKRNAQRAITENKKIPDEIIEYILSSFVPIQSNEGFNKVEQVR